MVTVKKHSRWTMPLVAVVFLLASVLQLLTPTLASADAASRLGPVNDKFYGARLLRDCLAQKKDKKTIKDAAAEAILADSVDAFGNPTGVDIGRWMEPDGGHVNCNNGAQINKAISALGFATVGDYLISIGYKKDTKTEEQCAGYGSSRVCKDITTATYTISGDDAANDLVGKQAQIAAAKFYMYQSIFNANCELSTTITGKGVAVTHKQVVEEPANSGKFKTKDVPSEFPVGFVTKITGKESDGYTNKTEQVESKDANAKKEIPKYDYNQNTTCQDLLGLLNGLAAAVARWDNDNKEDAVTSATSANNQGECNSQSPNWNAETNTCGEDAPTCTDQVKGIGWLICPTMEFLANINDMAYGVLASNFLQIDTGLVKGAEAPWAKFKDLANIAFVIALLFVIYSQVTSVGISNYGIKKMLPKIIVAALLVNLSFIICQIAVDLSNILGYGISRFFTGLEVGATLDSTTQDKLADKGLETFGIALNWTGAIGLIMVAGVSIAMAVSFPVVLSALLALAMIVLILLARKALIVLLIVIAPLAFVAYLLPNTEQWFKKWAKMFSTLLLLFPIIGLVFGASALAAKIVATAGGNKDDPDPLIQLAALGISALPFFVVPGLLKGAINAAGALGTKLSGLADRAGKSVGKNIKDNSQLGAYKKAWDRNQQIKRAQIQGGVYRGRGPLARLASSANSRLNSSRFTGQLGTRTAQQAAQMANKLEIENVEAAKAQIEQANLDSSALRALANGKSVAGLNGSDASTRAAAISTAADRGDFGTVKEGWDSVRGLTGKSGDQTRKAVADTLGRSQSRPTYLGQKALQEMRSGDAKTHDVSALEAIQGGAYSPEGIAKASKEELEEARRISQGDAAAEAKLTRAAADADAHSDISKTIGKTRGTIDKFKRGDFTP